MIHTKRGRVRALFAAAVLIASLTAPRAEDKFSAGEMLPSCQADRGFGEDGEKS